MKNNICTITDSLLDNVYPLGNEHSRVRAIELIKTEAVQKESIEFINLSSRIENLIDIVMFKFQLTPSMKSEVVDTVHECCTSCLAFDGQKRNYCHVHAPCVDVMMVSITVLIYRFAFCAFGVFKGAQNHR